MSQNLLEEKMTIGIGDLVDIVNDERYAGGIFTVVRIEEFRNQVVYHCIRGSMKYTRMFYDVDIKIHGENKPKFSVGDIVRAEGTTLCIIISSNRMGSIVRKCWEPGTVHRIQYKCNRQLKRIS